jgi:hypothetical protein
VVPVNQEPTLKYAVGKSTRPDHPKKINLSLLSQSSSKVRRETLLEVEKIRLLIMLENFEKYGLITAG